MFVPKSLKWKELGLELGGMRDCEAVKGRFTSISMHSLLEYPPFHLPGRCFFLGEFTQYNKRPLEISRVLNVAVLVRFIWIVVDQPRPLGF